MKKLLLCVAMLTTSSILFGAARRITASTAIAETLNSFRVNNFSELPLSIKLADKNILRASHLDALSFVGHEFEPITVTLTYLSGPVSYIVEAPEKGWLIANGGDSNEQELQVFDPKAGNARELSFELIVKARHHLPFTEKNTARPELEQ